MPILTSASLRCLASRLCAMGASSSFWRAARRQGSRDAREDRLRAERGLFLLRLSAHYLRRAIRPRDAGGKIIIGTALNYFPSSFQHAFEVYVDAITGHRE